MLFNEVSINMELSTKNLGNFCQHIPEIPLYHNRSESPAFLSEVENRFRLIFIQSGTGILHIEASKRAFIPPLLLCLDENETVTLQSSSAFSARSIYFHPSFVNNIFTLKNLRDESEEFNISDKRDRNWLIPFFQRNSNYIGILPLTPTLSRYILTIFDALESELAAQRDGYWPCRSRSQLIELLFLIERLYMEPEISVTVVLDHTSNLISEIIIYLHTHYSEKVTIADLTSIFHVNRTTLTEQFNKEVGVPIMTYLIQLRIRLATSFLRDTLIPVSEVEERTGFNDSSNFFRMFKKHIGLSPTDYRQKYCILL